MKYPLFKVHIPTTDAISAIQNVFSGGFINEGEQVTELTQKLSEKLGSNKLLLVNSCTSALTLALKLAGVRAGDEVITTPMTCVATNTPIISLGAKIVWADVDPVDGMIDGNDVRKKITEKTKAVIAVAWGGSPPNLIMLQDICKMRGVKLILDAAHAFGAKFLGRNIVEFSDFACFSFQAIKHFTTGDGGALVCSNENDFKRAKALKWFGLDRDEAKDAKGNWKGQQWDVDIKEAGFKYNMNNVAAAIGLSQLPYIDGLVQKHRDNASLYKELFADFAYLRDADQAQGSSFWVYTVNLKSNSAISRDELLSKLNEEGIGAGLVHVPNDNYTCFKDFKTHLPGVAEFSAHQFSLPCGWWLNEEDVRFIANRVKEILSEKV